MDFYEVVRQVVQLLQQQGRVTYRGLKFQCKLDDERLSYMNRGNTKEINTLRFCLMRAVIRL